MDSKARQEFFRVLDARELDTHELETVTGGGLWEAFLCFLHGGTDASHTHSRREGGGPRGA